MEDCPDGGATWALPGLDLDAACLLEAWDQGGSQAPARRALTLLSTAWPSASPERWLGASIGTRDGCLLTLHDELFGSTIEAEATCPDCAERLEVSLRTHDLRVEEPGGRGAVSIDVSGYRVKARLPTSGDLIALLEQPPEAAYEALLGRCVEVVLHGDGEADTSGLPAAVTAALAQEMAELDPQADVRLSLRCPTCDHRWSVAFDILAYLWDEIDDWARRLIREVHALASAYGWAERDILSMSARRRRLYLEMSGGWA